MAGVGITTDLLLTDILLKIYKIMRDLKTLFNLVLEEYNELDVFNESSTMFNVVSRCDSLTGIEKDEILTHYNSVNLPSIPDEPYGVPHEINMWNLKKEQINHILSNL